MKGMAVLALGLVVASCNKMDFDQDAYQKAKEAESRQKFINNVMGGQDIDPNQTWSTTKSVSITVTPQKDGILKIYAANPIGNIVAPLYTTTAVAGKETTFTVTRPADVEMLYATVLNEDGLIADLLAFNATEASVTVDMTDDTTTRSISRRAASAPTAPGYDQTNPIPVPAAPTDLPTSANANIKIENNTTTEWGYDGKTVFIAENVTLTITQQWGRAGSKVYMSKGSKIVNTSGTLYMSGSYIYNDGGTIEGGLLLDNNSVIWNKGTIDTKDANINYQNDNSLIYNSGMITANNFTVGQKGTLWNEGTVTCTGTLKGNNSSSQIYNGSGHNMTAARLELNNNSQYLWNDGTLTITGAIYSTNNATCINNGTLNAQSFDGSAGISFLNRTDKTVNISGGTTITNANSLWVNDGIYNTGTFLVQAGNSQVFNNCRLNVKGKFTMGNNDGSRFVLQGDASVICDSFDWNGDNYFFMGGGSLLKVANTLKSNNQNSDKGFFQTRSDEYAVITAKAITTDYPTGQWRAWYEGKIYIDTDSHFAFYSINDGQKNYKLTGGATLTTKQGTAPVKWEESTCRPAYNGNKVESDPVMYYYYAFEDLGTTDDFDFNDIVIRVSAPVNGKSTVTLMAAGGIYPAVVTYGTGASMRNIGEEVHAAFGVSTGNTDDMVNTGGKKKEFVTLGTIENLSANADMSQLPMGITVTGNNGQITRVECSVANKGKAPLMIAVSGYSSGENAGKWFWPLERTNISSAYTQFGEWGANASTNKDWYKNITNDKVYKWQ
jgi:hypothetical protein